MSLQPATTLRGGTGQGGVKHRTRLFLAAEPIPFRRCSNAALPRKPVGLDPVDRFRALARLKPVPCEAERSLYTVQDVYWGSTVGWLREFYWPLGRVAGHRAIDLGCYPLAQWEIVSGDRYCEVV